MGMNRGGGGGGIAQAIGRGQPQGTGGLADRFQQQIAARRAPRTGGVVGPQVDPRGSRMQVMNQRVADRRAELGRGAPPPGRTGGVVAPQMQRQQMMAQQLRGRRPPNPMGSRMPMRGGRMGRGGGRY